MLCPPAPHWGWQLKGLCQEVDVSIVLQHHHKHKKAEPGLLATRGIKLGCWQATRERTVIWHTMSSSWVFQSSLLHRYFLIKTSYQPAKVSGTADAAVRSLPGDLSEQSALPERGSAWSRARPSLPTNGSTHPSPCQEGLILSKANATKKK